MKIAKVRVSAITLTVRPDLFIISSAGRHTISHYPLVSIETDEGLTGWGEATVVPLWSGETKASAAALIQEHFAPILKGRDPFDIEAIMRALDREAVDNHFTKASIEMALLDLIGKKLNIPVYQYLGGKYNSPQIPIKFSIGAREPEEAAELALKKVQKGFKALKIKVGPDEEKDLLRVSLIREVVGPHIRLNIDVNGGWNVKQAIQLISRFQRFDLEYVEQPVPRWDVEGMAEVRAAVEIPVMADESVFSIEQALQVIRKKAADIISVYPGKNGGVLRSQTICKMAEAAGIACHIGSNLEWDVGTSAMCHLAVASPNVRVQQYPVDILGPLYYDTHLAGNPIRFREGTVMLPEGPGLGLKIEEDEIRRLTTRTRGNF